jgi:hypothetical protein
MLSKIRSPWRNWTARWPPESQYPKIASIYLACIYINPYFKRISDSVSGDTVVLTGERQ